MLYTHCVAPFITKECYKECIDEWKHMKCSSHTQETDTDNIDYYHLIIDDYFAHTIVAEGVEVETCFEDKHDGVLMSWACNKKCCKPLKCEFKKEEEQKKVFKLLGNKKKDTTFTIWAYNKELKRTMPLTCSEITLPN